MPEHRVSKQSVEESDATPARSRKYLLIVVILCVLGAASIYVGALQKAQATDLFRQYVLDPIPASVTDIKVDQPMTHGGYGYVFRFGIKRADLELVRKSRPFREAETSSYADGKGLSWKYKNWDRREPAGEPAGTFRIYGRAHKPSWYDLAAWEDPEAYALTQRNKDKSMDVQVLLYHAQLGQAYFVTFYYDGRGL